MGNEKQESPAAEILWLRGLRAFVAENSTERLLAEADALDAARAEAEADKPFQMLVSSIDYNEFVGRIAIGRIERGTVKQNQEIAVCNFHQPDAAPQKAKV